MRVNEQVSRGAFFMKSWVATKVFQPLASVKFTDILVVSTFVLQSFFLIGSLAYFAYFDVNVLEVISFNSVDGWCDPPLEGIGVHCFGDFAMTRTAVLADDPWGPEVALHWIYPAGGMLYSAIFIQIGSLLEVPGLDLVLFLITSFALIVLPGVWASRGQEIKSRVLIIISLGVISVPAINMLDRGNSLVSMVPALLIFLIGISRDSRLLLVIGITAASLVKPQFTLLILFPLFVKQTKTFWVAGFSILICHLTAFLFWPTNFPYTLWENARNILGYGSGHSLLSPISNISFAKGLHDVASVLDSFTGTHLLSNVFEDYRVLLTGTLVATLLVLMFALRKYLTTFKIGTFLIVVASLGVPVSWAYYAAFAIPVAAVMIRGELSTTKPSLHRPHYPGWKLEMASDLSITIALIFTLSRIVILIVEPELTSVWTSSSMIPVSWTVAIILSLLHANSVRKSDAKKVPSDL